MKAVFVMEQDLQLELMVVYMVLMPHLEEYLMEVAEEELVVAVADFVVAFEEDLAYFDLLLASMVVFALEAFPFDEEEEVAVVVAMEHYNSLD